ncbi:MAG: hypothetical protein U0324_13270 [Polyangiales bacterium]
MQLPVPNSSPLVHVRYGRYVIRRLRRKKLHDLADACERRNRELLDASRAAEDAGGPVQDATADRDACDDALDVRARDVRHALASRSRDAVTQAPYTRVFPEGVAHYTDASLDEEVRRYTQLATRLDAHLAPDDPLRKEDVPALREDLALYQESAAALDAARLAEDEADARLTEAAGAWRSQFERAYGGLIERLGKAEAERFFPAVAKTRAKKGAAAPQPAPARPSAPPVQ